MKKILCSSLVLSVALIAGCALTRSPDKEAPQKAKLVVMYWDESGGDKDQARYDTKMEVFIDGVLAGESEVADRYERKILSAEIEPGSHVVIIEGHAKPDGEWEKRTKDRGYSIDHRLEQEFDIGAGERRIINFVVPDRAKRHTIKL